MTNCCAHGQSCPIDNCCQTPYAQRYSNGHCCYNYVGNVEYWSTSDSECVPQPQGCYDDTDPTYCQNTFSSQTTSPWWSSTKCHDKNALQACCPITGDATASGYDYADIEVY